MQDINEQSLLNGIKERSQASFRLLYETYHAPLFRFAESYVLSPDIAEDIVQEVFIKLWEDRKIKISKSLKGYLFFMVKNASLNYLRTIQLEDKRKTNLMEGQILSDVADLDLDDEVSRKIKSAIQELPPQCQKVYSLSIYSGLKQSEIAEELGISVNTVKAQIHRAKHLLREKLYQFRDLLILYSHLLRIKSRN